ncbi:MAG: hypothetical protein ACP5N1_05515, partial [Candidatus Woesearchaeota archaeon]
MNTFFDRLLRKKVAPKPKEYISDEVKFFLEEFPEEFVQKYNYKSFGNLDELIADRSAMIKEIYEFSEDDNMSSSIRHCILDDYIAGSKLYLLSKGMIHITELPSRIYDGLEVKFLDGESGSEIVFGKLVSQTPKGPLNKPATYVLERYPQVIKKYSDWFKARSEQNLAYLLSGKVHAENANLDFVSVDNLSLNLLSNHELNMSFANGKTLLDIMLNDKDQTRKKDIKKHYFKLIDYAVDTAIAMNNFIIIDPVVEAVTEERYGDLSRKNNLSLEDAINIGDTLKIMDSLNGGNPVNTNVNSSESNIEFEKFKNAYSKVQQFVNKYNSRHAIWLSDRNSKNIKILEFENESLYNNYDTGNIIKDSLMAEVSSILTQSSDYFTTKEQESFARYAAKRWNFYGYKRKIVKNSDMITFLHCKNFYRRVRDMDQKMKSTSNLYGVQRSIQHFEYLDSLDGAYVQKDSALYELDLLFKYGLVDDDSKKYISQSIEKRFDSFMQALPSKEDIELDRKIYSLIKKEGLYHRFSQSHNYD